MIPQPPGWMAMQAGHHWLDHFDSDGHFHGTVVLQWAPSAKKWCHSGNVGTGMYVDVTEHWRYSAECPMPDFPERA